MNSTCGDASVELEGLLSRGSWVLQWSVGAGDAVVLAAPVGIERVVGGHRARRGRRARRRSVGPRLRTLHLAQSGHRACK